MCHYSYGLCGFPFRTSKLKNNINYIKYKFSHKFEKVCRFEHVLFKDYNNNIFKTNNRVHLNHFKESCLDS
jgi:hypothetical protein